MLQQQQKGGKEERDVVELVSIGAIHRGDWENKYWSCTRGKNRHPYPVGYHAFRIRNGNRFEMQITRGLKGPSFVITNAEGQSFTGPTPDMVWELFQRKGLPRIKVKSKTSSSSCKIDGAELFGFKNLLVQQLFRQLVANLSGTAERNLSSANCFHEVSSSNLQSQSMATCAGPNLLTTSMNPQSTEKRSTRGNVATIHAASSPGFRRLQTLGQSCDTEVVITTKVGQKHDSSKERLSSSSSDEDYEIDKNPNDSSIPDTSSDEDCEIVPDSNSDEDCEIAPDSSSDKDCEIVPDSSSDEDCEIDKTANDTSIVPDTSLHEDCEIDKNPNDSQIAPDSFSSDGKSYCSFKDGSFIKSSQIADSLREDNVFGQDHKFGGPEDAGFTTTVADPSKQMANLDRSFAVTEGCNSLNTAEDDIQEEMILSESETNKNSELCAPDTLDVVRVDRCSDSEPEFNKGHPCNIQKAPPASNTVVSKDIVSSVNEEELATSYSSRNSEKSCSDSPREELTKSMMTLLLPQALPLLKKTSSRKRPRVHTSGISSTTGTINLKLAAPKTDGIHPHTEILPRDEPEVGILDGYPEKGAGEINVARMAPALGAHSCKEHKSVVPDSFQDDQSRCTINQLSPTCSKSVDTDQAILGKMEINPANLELLGCIVPSDPNIAENEKLNGNFELKKDGKFSSNSISRCMPVNSQIDLGGHTKGVCMTPGWNSLCLETFPGEDECMNTDLDFTSDPVKEIPASEPTYLKGDQDMCVETISHFKVPVLSPANELSTNLRCKEATYKGFNTSRLSLKRDLKYPDQRADKSYAHKLEKELGCLKTGVSIDTVCPVQVPDSHSTKVNNAPLSESIICRNTRESCLPENQATESSLATESGQACDAGECINREMPFMNEVKLDQRHEGLVIEKGADGSNDIFSNIVSLASEVQPVVGYTAKDNCTLSFVDQYIPNAEKYNADAVRDYSDSSLLWLELDKNLLDENGHSNMDIDSGSNVQPHSKSELASDQYSKYLLSESELQDYFLQDSWPCDTTENGSEGLELVGCYIQSEPVLSVELNTQENFITIFVLCGHLTDRNRTIFIYKIPSVELRGCPSFLGYTSIMSASEGTVSGQNAFKRSDLQFTPDGQYLVLPNNIKAPYCRQCSIHCSCSRCASGSLEENGMKIVQIKFGYASVVVKLKTDECVRCLLVCQPNHLAAVEESGKLHVWIMNSKWRLKAANYLLDKESNHYIFYHEKVNMYGVQPCGETSNVNIFNPNGFAKHIESIEEFNIPGWDHMYPCAVELKGIPKYTSLVIGHNGVGDFALWDISNRTILSMFSAPGNSVCQIIPVSLFIRDGKEPIASNYNVEEQVNKIMAATEMSLTGSTENIALYASGGEDVAVWLLVSAACHSDFQYNHQPNGINTSETGFWRLALLMKKTVIFGSPLDSRASSVAALDGLGIIGTHDGLMYTWNLSTGIKLDDLHNFNGGPVSCISPDPKSSMVAVVGDENQLLVYRIQRP